MIVETNGENGSVHSSYLLVEDLNQREIISNLVLAVHQEEQEQKQEQPANEEPQDELRDDKERTETRAQIYVNCKLAGTVILTASPRHMKDNSQRHHPLRVVNIIDCFLPVLILIGRWCTPIWKKKKKKIDVVL